MTTRLGCWLTLLPLLASCASLGPTVLRGGRPAYNEAIATTDNEQMLALIVRQRYGESYGLLAVSSVTANMHVRANAGAELGIGPDSSYEGNLVPLSAGVGYEENPTIVYTPVQGTKYLREILSPLPPDLTVLLIRAMCESPQAVTFLLRSINGIRNPDFLADPSVEVDPRFTRLVDLVAELARQDRITWAEEPGEPAAFVLSLAGEGDAFAGQVRELYGLLGFAAPQPVPELVTLPVQIGIGRPTAPGLRIEPRALYDLIEIVAASVDVPEEDLASGRAPALPPLGAAGRAIHVRRSADRPEQAIIAVPHRGWWYSIDGRDADSKLSFRILESLISVRIADTVGHRSAAPVLTVPVSR